MQDFSKQPGSKYRNTTEPTLLILEIYTLQIPLWKWSYLLVASECKIDGICKETWNTSVRKESCSSKFPFTRQFSGYCEWYRTRLHATFIPSINPGSPSKYLQESYWNLRKLFRSYKIVLVNRRTSDKLYHLELGNISRNEPPTECSDRSMSLTACKLLRSSYWQQTKSLMSQQISAKVSLIV
jgi:hypothetical protein